MIIDSLETLFAVDNGTRRDFDASAPTKAEIEDLLQKIARNSRCVMWLQPMDKVIGANLVGVSLDEYLANETK